MRDDAEIRLKKSVGDAKEPVLTSEQDQSFEQATVHPVARLILGALQEQDVALYNGTPFDMGRVAMDTAAQAIEVVEALLDFSNT